MVERYEFTCPDCDPDAIAVNHGRYVRHSDYARLQEQLEVVTRERDHWIAESRRNLQAGQDAAYKLEAAEAERDRLREMILGAADQCDKWVKETYDGGWSTHQVRGQCALAESLRLAAKGEAE